MIFKDFTRKELMINWDNYGDEISEAIAKDYINDELEADWESTSEMQEIYHSLSRLNRIFKKDIKDDFQESFNNDFEAPLKFDNITFWQEVFGLSIFL